jgi:drug/metabolite transporter (DMT)-like permease
MPAVRSMGPVEWASLLVLSVLWGAAFFFYKVLDDAGVPPFTIAFVRVAVAAAVLLPVVFATGRRLPASLPVWGAFAVTGALNNVIPFSLIAFGETHIVSGLAAIYNATTPLFTALIAHAVTSDERLTAPKVAGIAIGLGGVAIMMGPSALHGLNATAIAQLACVVAAVVYACGAIYARRFRALGVDPLVLSTGQLCASTVMALPLVAGFDRPWALLPTLSLGVWAAWLGLAIPSTALAYVLYFRLIAVAGATNAASVTFLVPVSALLLGTFALRERLAPSSVAGMIAVFAGLAVIDGRLFAWLGGARARRAA